MTKIGSRQRQISSGTIRSPHGGAASSTFAHEKRIMRRNRLVRCARVCVLREWDPLQTGVSMWGGLRRPMGPSQVSCVLATAVLAAGFSAHPLRQFWGPCFGKAELVPRQRP